MSNTYRKRWRKLRADARAAALESSSEEEVGDNLPLAIANEPSLSSSDTDQSNYELIDNNESGSDYGFQEDIVSSESDGSIVEEDLVEEGPSIRQEIAAWSAKNLCVRTGTDSLLAILRRQGLDLPKDSRTLLDTPRNVPTENKCGGTYAYFGLEAALTKVLSSAKEEHVKDLVQIELLVNVDGVPVFKSSGTQFWPILCCFKDFNPFLVALFYGDRKPSSVDDFLQDFLREYSEISRTGIVFGHTLLQVRIKAFICDAPARAFLKCCKGHTGYNSCERCTLRGEYKHNRVVLLGSSELRTDTGFSSGVYADHQTGVSPLQYSSVKCVKEFCLDYMHLVCLGTVKRLLHFLKQGPKECKLSHRQISDISSSLVSFSGKLPSEFARQPRPLSELDRWKATEFRQFVLYTGPVVLRKVLHAAAYQHFLCLTVAISILLDSCDAKRETYLDYARQLLEHFVDKSVDIYTESFVVYNIHSLKHLADDARHMKCSLNSISAFPFENHLQVVKRLVRTSKNHVAQVVKRLHEREKARFQHSNKPYTNLSYVSANKRNGCLLLANDDFAFVIEKRDGGRLVCDIIRQRNVDSFFSEPCDSKLLNIVYVKNFQTVRKTRRLVEAEEVSRKVVCLPYQRGYVLLPLLHGMEKSAL
jgi:hypothetical protein